MSQRFRLIERKNLGKDKETNPKKFYAQATNNGYVSFDEVCVEISEYCSLTSADVKAVMDRMNYVLDKNLKAGRIIQFGEIGNFRLSMGSAGSVDEKDFDSSMIKKPRIVFTPGTRLQSTREQTSFERVAPVTVSEPCDKEHIV